MSHAAAPGESATNAAPVMRVNGADRLALATMLDRYGLELRFTAPDEIIPGSYWGDSEAGLIDNRLYLRYDTPLHSVLHEACHYICMSPERRVGLNRDAGGDDPEEEAVCYLQVLLAEQIPGFGRARLLADMDAWGYSFRLGSAGSWFEQDALRARDWLQRERIIDTEGRLTWALRS